MKIKVLLIALIGILIAFGIFAISSHTSAVKQASESSSRNSTKQNSKKAARQSIKKAAASSSTAESEKQNDNIIYLTFDDGPDDATTPQLLSILKEEKIHTTFFVTGHGSDQLIKQECADGHKIGLHTMTHDYGSVYASPAAYFTDLQQISDRVFRLTGQRSMMVRVPGGSANQVSHGFMPQILPQLVQAGYKYFDWNVSSGDGGFEATPEEPYQHVTTTLVPHSKNVVLMHDTKQNSIDAVKRIIEFGKANNYKFETLNMDSWAPQQIGVN